MPQTRPNKTKVPVNSDAYNLAPDLAAFADSANVVIPVNSQAERDGLTPTGGMAVSRLDRNGDLEIWTGSAWRTAVETGPVVTSDANWGFNGQLVRACGTNGNYTVTLAERMARVGAGFTLTTSYITMIAGFIPSGWRPVATFNGWALLTSGADVAQANMWWRITTAGDLQARLDSGSLTLATGWVFNLQGSWTTA